jgi:hypothetical protein
MTAKTKQTEIETPVVDTEVVPTPPTEHTLDVASIRPRSSFGKTFYYVDLERDRAVKGPNQLLGMIKFMIENGITSPETARQGAEIGAQAVADGYVTTAKLTGEVIFAYYIRRMEKEFGIEHAKTVHAKTNKIMA